MENFEEPFINRKRELAILNAQYQANGSAFMVLYGRRRMGKTSLMRKFLSDKPNCVYYFADKDTEANQINKFKNIVGAWSEDTLLQNVELNNWDEAFQYFIQKMPQKERVILVIDEFQYLAMANAALPSILQRIWDMQLKSKNIMLVLCGSHVSMMYQTTLSHGSPLYGRRTGSIKLTGIAFEYIHEFLDPKASKIKSVEYFALTSGIPKYMEVLDKSKSMIENIERLFLTKDAFFYNETRFILGEELKEQYMYFSILRAIAYGNAKAGDIAASLNEQSNKIMPYLNVLQELELIERRVPITESMPQKSRKGLYFMKDNMMRFWFRYVFQYQSLLEMGRIEPVKQKIMEEWNQIVSLPFEDVCRQIVVDHCPFIPQNIGAWWDKGEEIDLVSTNAEEGKILFGECKWSEQPLGIDVYASLKAKSKLVDWKAGNRTEFFILFSKKGFTNSLYELEKEEKNLKLVDFSKI